jgi:hypothetical protein
MRVRTKIKILKIVILHVTLGGVFSLNEVTHPMDTRKGLGIILVLKGEYIS